MNKPAVYTIILLILVIIIALLGFLILRQPAAEKEVPTPTPVNTDTAIQPPREEEPSPTPTPTETPEPTDEPVFETRPPVETEKPEETPEPTPTPTPDASGSFSSNTGTGLNIRVDWYTLPGGQRMQVDVSCVSYSIYSAAQWQSVQLTVGGQTHAADSRAISHEGSDQVVSPLASFTVDTPPSGSPISVSWNYRGSYSGQELDEIVATGSLNY